MKQLDEFECLRLWLADLRQDISSQYLFDERKEHISDLMLLFTTNNIAQDDAQMMKNKVVEALVTKDGMRGNGKYKNWKQNAENDFDDAIQLTYVKPHVKTITSLKTAQGYDPRIVKWAKDKYGAHVGDEFIKAAHQPLHLFWIEWMTDYHKLDFGGKV